ncbi:MAG: hypothetical protein ACYC2U_04865 [Candidatus Amoebophilus sp.]
MRKVFICTLLSVVLSSQTTVKTERLGVPVAKTGVLSFDEDILDVELGNEDYEIDLKGENIILISAKKKDAQPTTLFVRYASGKGFYFSEIYPDAKAPLQRFIKHKVLPSSAKEVHAQGNRAQNVDIFIGEPSQEYMTFGEIHGGIKVILTNIIHQGEATYLRFSVENNTTTNLKLSHFTFEYLTYLRKFLLFKNTKTKLVNPLLAPTSIELKPRDVNYFVFAIPSYISNGGLKIFLGESAGKGEREFKIHVPTKILLKAKRK